MKKPNHNKTLSSLLNKQIVIEAPTQIPDGVGGFEVVWQEKCRVWAVAYPVSTMSKSSTIRHHHKQTDRMVYQINIRARAGIAPKMRLVMDGKILHIKNVFDPDGTGRKLEIIAQEGVVI